MGRQVIKMNRVGLVVDMSYWPIAQPSKQKFLNAHCHYACKSTCVAYCTAQQRYEVLRMMMAGCWGFRFIHIIRKQVRLHSAKLGEMMHARQIYTVFMFGDRFGIYVRISLIVLLSGCGSGVEQEIDYGEGLSCARFPDVVCSKTTVILKYSHVCRWHVTPEVDGIMGLNWYRFTKKISAQRNMNL